MTEDDILRMAREAGGVWEYRRTFPVACVMYDEELVKFARLISAEEREECAKVCDELVAHIDSDEDRNGWLAALACGTAIRARGEK